MKIRIAYTINVPDEIRRAINAWYGDAGLADRGRVQRWYEQNGKSMDQNIAEQYCDEHPFGDYS